jgi:hypothetical protein
VIGREYADGIVPEDISEFHSALQQRGISLSAPASWLFPTAGREGSVQVAAGAELRSKQSAEP